MAIYEIPQDSKTWIKKELNKKYSSDKAEEKYQEIIELYEKFQYYHYNLLGSFHKLPPTARFMKQLDRLYI